MAETPLPKPEDLLAHRGIALVLDEITELVPGVRAAGLWTPTGSYYEGHFPQEAILPGHWTTESVALIGACAFLAERPDLLPMFRENYGKFKGIVRPKDILEVSAEFQGLEEIERGGERIVVASGKGKAKVNGKTIYQAMILKAVAEV